MSDKTQLRWESPLDIYVPHELNNRSLDTGYVESLEDSMRTQGYLPTYPIICYRRLELPKELFDGKTDALYICAAGFHRTTAAKNINLDRVYVELRSGTFEDYLETLNTDNFQFDPEVDTSLGQIWTKTDKRKACKQLLLLPKYFKLTNIALADLWHTSEANIRRWRDDVASSIDEGSLDAPFPISQEWQDNLKAILDSNVREMADGSVIKVRSKSEENKWDYYWALQKKVENHKDLGWSTEIEPYCKKMYEKEARDLSLKKLAELDQLIAVHDPEFMKMCRELGEEKRKLNAAQEECHKAYKAAKKAFETYVFGQDLAENTYEEKYKNCLKSFGRAVSRTFGQNLLGSMLYTDKVHKYENKTYQLQQLKKDIEASVDYVQAFAQRMLNAQRKKRENLGQAVIDAHYKMLTAAQEKYPGIDMEKFCFAVDADCSLWLDIGDTPATPMHSTQDIPDGKSDGNLIRIAEHYEKMLEKIEKGADWIAKLVPESLPLQDALDEMKAKAAEKAEVLGKFRHQKRDLYARIHKTPLVQVKDEFGNINTDKALHGVMLAAYKQYELDEALLWSDQAIEALPVIEVNDLTAKYFLIGQDLVSEPRADWVANLYQDVDVTDEPDTDEESDEDTSLTEIDNLPAVKHFLESLLKQTKTFIHPHDKDDFSVAIHDALLSDGEVYLTERQQLLILIDCAYSIVMESESTSF